MVIQVCEHCVNKWQVVDLCPCQFDMLKLNILVLPTAKIGRSGVAVDPYPVKSLHVFSLQFKLIFCLRSSGSVFQNHHRSATTYPHILELVEYDIKRTQNLEDDPQIL